MNWYRSHVPGMRASGHSARTRTRALVKARVRAVGREFRRGLLAPRWIPQSSNVERDNGIGRLARIGCSRPAALLNLMPFFFASAFANFGSFVSELPIFESVFYSWEHRPSWLMEPGRAWVQVLVASYGTAAYYDQCDVCQLVRGALSTRWSMLAATGNRYSARKCDGQAAQMW